MGVNTKSCLVIQLISPYIMSFADCDNLVDELLIFIFLLFFLNSNNLCNYIFEISVKIYKASFYDLRIALDFKSLETEFLNQTQVTEEMIVSGTNLSNPSEAGALERITIYMPTKGIGQFITRKVLSGYLCITVSTLVTAHALNSVTIFQCSC